MESELPGRQESWAQMVLRRPGQYVPLQFLQYRPIHRCVSCHRVRLLSLQRLYAPQPYSAVLDWHDELQIQRVDDIRQTGGECSEPFGEHFDRHPGAVGLPGRV